MLHPMLSVCRHTPVGDTAGTTTNFVVVRRAEHSGRSTLLSDFLPAILYSHCRRWPKSISRADRSIGGDPALEVIGIGNTVTVGVGLAVGEGQVGPVERHARRRIVQKLLIEHACG